MNFFRERRYCLSSIVFHTLMLELEYPHFVILYESLIQPTIISKGNQLIKGWWELYNVGMRLASLDPHLSISASLKCGQADIMCPSCSRRHTAPCMKYASPQVKLELNLVDRNNFQEISSKFTRNRDRGSS